MRRLFYAITLLVIMLPCIASAQDNVTLGKPWETFRGLPFGASESYVKELFPHIYCRSVKASVFNADKFCEDRNFRIGEVQVENIFEFLNDKLVKVRLSFRSEVYGYIKEVFIIKYGNPHHVRTEVIENKARIQYDNEILTWKGNDVYLMLNRYQPGNIDYSIATFLPASYAEKIIEDSEAKKKQAISGF